MSLKLFHKAVGAGKQYAQPTLKELARLDKLAGDAELLGEWREQGFRSYLDGAFWLVNPLEFADVLREWYPKARNTYAFARSAFGDLLIARGADLYHLHVHYGKEAGVGEDSKPGFWLQTALEKNFVKVGLQGGLAARAVKKCGALAPDEMFTFEPALALGGPEEIKHVRKVKMLPQLSLLAQLA